MIVWTLEGQFYVRDSITYVKTSTFMRTQKRIRHNRRRYNAFFDVLCRIYENQMIHSWQNDLRRAVLCSRLNYLREDVDFYANAKTHTSQWTTLQCFFDVLCRIYENQMIHSWQNDCVDLRRAVLCSRLNYLREDVDFYANAKTHTSQWTTLQCFF
jgi:hypothetical protein